MMPMAVEAALWGLLAGAALVVGAALAWFFSISQRIIAGVMAFGSGVLISALSFELMDEAYKRGGFIATSVGFLGGAAIYTAANIYISRRGARYRKRSEGPPDQQDSQNGTAFAIGGLLDAYQNRSCSASAGRTRRS